MQGFNRYVPPDYDPKKASTLNSYQGKKHALGKRAKDIDKGVLVVRFELPFNIWCESCGNHIGAGVRYNAQKKKVGNYISSPIYGFRCKCHLCSNWFEIRTDPKNAAYIVHEGAKRQNDEWDPQANGGFAPVDTEAPSAADIPVDAFAATEKTIDQQQWARKNTSRLTELSELSDRQSSDPYEVSQNLRRRFRIEKAEMLEKQARDEGVRARYGLGDEVDLGEEDGDAERARGMWVAGRERAGLSVDEDPIPEGSGLQRPPAISDSVRAVDGITPSSTRLSLNTAAKGSSSGASPSLVQALRKSTKRRYDPFSDAADAFVIMPAKRIIATPKSRGKIRDTEGIEATPAKLLPQTATNGKGGDAALNAAGCTVMAKTPEEPVTVSVGLGMLAGYGSD